MNNNNWGSQQPPRQAYNGLPQMAAQPGYQQQYGQGNSMAFMGNQQYQPSGQYMPQPSLQMQQQMPHYTQPQQHQQHQQPTHSYHAQQQHPHQQHQQHQQQIYTNSSYAHHGAHHVPPPPAQYMTPQNYSQPTQPYAQQVTMPSPQQMQQSIPSPRPDMMAQPQQAQTHLQRQQPQPVPQPLQPRFPPPQQARPTIPSPQQQPHHAPHLIKSQQFHQGQPHVMSPQSSNRPLQTISPNPHHQSQSPAPSPQLQYRTSPSVNPNQLQRQAYIPSPQLQHNTQPPIEPNQFRKHSQTHIPSPQPQHTAHPSIDPNQLRQVQTHIPSPEIQHSAQPPIDPNQLRRSQSHVSSPETQHNAYPSIDPSQLRKSQAHVPPAPPPELQHNVYSSVDPNQLQRSQSHVPSPELQHNAYPQVDPGQLRKGQTQVSSPQTQRRASASIKPTQLQNNLPKQSPRPQPREQTSIDPTQLHNNQSYIISTESLQPVPDAINPSSLQQPPPRPQAPPPPEPQRPTFDAIDPTKLQQTQTLEAPTQVQRSASDVIDPSQLMLKMEAPARKSMPAAPSATKSPSVSHAHSPSQHFDTPAVLICVADDCFRAAHAAVQDLATSLDQATMNEYYKLIATGLGCLEAALALNKLLPRAEANIRLRYATILSEETDNLTEAEVALTKGIAVCEKARLTDLKYCMQFQLLKVLHRRNRKAALVALDKNISEATTYKAVDWVYAFRFLRASFHLQSGNPADTHAMENLRNITSLATHRGDHAIAVLTSLLEGIDHLKSRKEDSIVRVQTCIAQAARHQLDPSVHIPQIEVLTLLLDMACSLQQKAPQVAMQKLKALQFRMDELVQTSDWDQMRDELLLPLKRQPNSSSTVTDDTKTIIRPGSEYNYIVMSFVTKVHAFVLAYVLSGLALLYHGSKNEKLLEYWTEALNMLARKSGLVRPAAHSLPMAIEQAKWRSEVGCYIHTLTALISATRTQWTKVHDCIQKIEALRPKPRAERLDLLVLYVKGAYHQGTGDLGKADEIFSDSCFDVAEPSNASPGSTGTAPSEMALLAALNRIWIMQEPSRRNDQQTMELLEKVRPYCADHADIDIRTAFNLVAASIETAPPQSIQTVKRHISTGLKFAQAANNTQLLSVALNLMRSCLFESVVGDQAVKSAKAGKAQAGKAGNLLWMSVGEGMLAQTEEMQGQVQEAERLRADGTAHANEAFVKPQGV